MQECISSRYRGVGLQRIEYGLILFALYLPSFGVGRVWVERRGLFQTGSYS